MKYSMLLVALLGASTVMANEALDKAVQTNANGQVAETRVTVVMPEQNEKYAAISDKIAALEAKLGEVVDHSHDPGPVHWSQNVRSIIGHHDRLLFAVREELHSTNTRPDQIDYRVELHLWLRLGRLDFSEIENVVDQVQQELP